MNVIDKKTLYIICDESQWATFQIYHLIKDYDDPAAKDLCNVHGKDRFDPQMGAYGHNILRMTVKKYQGASSFLP